MWLPPLLEALSRRVFPDPGRRAIALKAASFAMVGVVNASVDFGVFSFFYFYLAFPIILAINQEIKLARMIGNASVDFGVFSFFYFYLAFPIILANLISWFIAVSGSYVMNSMTTFAAESGRKLRLRSYATFLLAQVAGLVANTATVYLVPIVIGKILGIPSTSTT